eukprot:4169865-Pyramimonas_sp.AAC.1
MGQSQMWNVLGRDELLLVIMFPDCKAFSPARVPSWDEMSPEALAAVEQMGLEHLHLCAQVARRQMERGRHLALGHPIGAISWELQEVRDLMGAQRSSQPSPTSASSDCLWLPGPFPGSEPD